MTVSEAIRTILKERNITLSDFAEQIGMKKQNLSNKLGRDNFTSQELYIIAKALDVDIIIKGGKNGEYKIGYTKEQLTEFEQKRKQETQQAQKRKQEKGSSKGSEQ